MTRSCSEVNRATISGDLALHHGGMDWLFGQVYAPLDAGVVPARVPLRACPPAGLRSPTGPGRTGGDDAAAGGTAEFTYVDMDSGVHLRLCGTALPTGSPETRAGTRTHRSARGSTRPPHQPKLSDPPENPNSQATSVAGRAPQRPGSP